MKKAILFLSLFACLFSFSGQIFAQRQIEVQVQRDPILEADANHNLEAAQLYFKTRKAYKAVLMRFEETFAAYPDYSKMDEFLYLAAMSSYYLSEGKGKQKIDLNRLSEEEKKKYAPEKLREDAVAYFAMIIEKYPQSRFKADAEKILKEIQSKK
ncbi:MAG TPA: hypothetical protein PKE69_02175 [Pyrinomonadaceae bacterium]|nr:hypothetical protein [Pyrinomonadaceae bacterium]